MWLTNVQCTGGEAKLSECSWSWDTSVCDESEAVSVVCYGKWCARIIGKLCTAANWEPPTLAHKRTTCVVLSRPCQLSRPTMNAHNIILLATAHGLRPTDERPLRLAGGEGPYQGRLEVQYFNGTWSSVCGEHWGFGGRTTDKVCRSTRSMLRHKEPKHWGNKRGRARSGT